MNRAQAHKLWFDTLALGLDLEVSALGRMWQEAGLGGEETAALGVALEQPDRGEARRRLIRKTREVLLEQGWDPDLISTPAAPMRGL